MRFVVYGAGAIGGFVAGALHRSGSPVLLVARGENLARIRSGGLILKTPGTAERIPIAVKSPGELTASDADRDTMVLLCVKSQHTLDALLTLRRALPDPAAVACLQNGVENEHVAERFFPSVYGVSVMCPNVYLEPGVVSGFSSPVRGVLDVGRHVGGSDAELAELVVAFTKAGFSSEAVADIRAVKYGRLLGSLGTVVEALCGPPARRGPITEAAQREARACLAAAGIAVDERPARDALITPTEVDGSPRPAGPVWQSVRRGQDSTETDFLNGEICALGRRHGVPTPVNALLQRLIRELNGAPERIAAYGESEVLAMAGAPDR